jgi:hypothetical protein
MIRRKRIMKWFNTTSKKLTWVSFMFYVIQVAFSEYVQVFKGTDVSNLLVYTTPLMVSVFGAYFYKSKVENITAMNQSTTQG